MPTYIMLANWTDQGAQKVKDSPRRLETAKKALFDMGGEFKTVYMTLGEYDLVGVYEAPDDAVAARFSLMLGMLGSVRTTTMKAFPEAAYREIIASLGFGWVMNHVLSNDRLAAVIAGGVFMALAAVLMQRVIDPGAEVIAEAAPLPGDAEVIATLKPGSVK